LLRSSDTAAPSWVRLTSADASMPAVDPIEVGDTLRSLIRVELLGKDAPEPVIPVGDIREGLQEIGAISWRLRKQIKEVTE